MSLVDLIHPSDFFRGKVSSAASNLKLSITEEVEFYLVNVCEFIQPQQRTVEEIDLLDTPLALIYKKALEASPGHASKDLLKKLGDTSLYIAGYFQDSLNRKTVGARYFISMGSNAYEKISEIMRDRHSDSSFSAIYQELAKDFAKLVSLITEVAEDTAIDATGNLIALYEKWERTGSENLRKKLEGQGISPVPGVKKPVNH